MHIDSSICFPNILNTVDLSFSACDVTFCGQIGCSCNQNQTVPSALLYTVCFMAKLGNDHSQKTK